MSTKLNANPYAERLTRLSDAALFDEAVTQIGIASFGKNDPWSDAHGKLDSLYDECTERGLDILHKAYLKAKDQAGR